MTPDTQEPTLVEVATVPVPVAIAEVSAPVPVTLDPTSAPMPVTFEPPKRQEPTVASVNREILKSAGQRFISEKWEDTQRLIALGAFFIAAIINSVVIVLLLTSPTEIPAPTVVAVFAALAPMNGMASSVISSYFARTNHTAIGGVGSKDDDNQPYQGR